MTRQWKRLIYVMLGMQLLVFGYFYYWGQHGLQYLTGLKKERIEKLAILDDLHMQSELLQDQIEDFSTSEFLKEKFARQRLCMKKDGDVVYFR